MIDTTVVKEVRVTVSMPLDELQVLNAMLTSWYNEVGKKLPGTLTVEQGMILDTLSELQRTAEL